MSNNKKALLIINHEPTEHQIEDLYSHGVTELIEMPQYLKNLWIDIPADFDSVTEFMIPLEEWIDKNAEKKDMIWVQGEHGATFNIVSYCLKKNFSSFYATSQRILKEEVNESGVVTTKRIFKHIKFRKYENNT